MVTMPGAVEEQLAVVRRAPRARPAPARSSRSSVPSKSAPRGTAIISLLAHRERLLGGLRLVHALDVERDPARRERAAEAPDQLVVAPAAAEREAHRRVVDLEHGARVVAELAHEAEVEDHALGHAALGEQGVKARAARPRPRARAPRRGRARRARRAARAARPASRRASSPRPSERTSSSRPTRSRRASASSSGVWRSSGTSSAAQQPRGRARRRPRRSGGAAARPPRAPPRSGPPPRPRPRRRARRSARGRPA